MDRGAGQVVVNAGRRLDRARQLAMRVPGRKFGRGEVPDDDGIGGRFRGVNGPLAAGDAECVSVDDTLTDAARKLRDLQVGAKPMCGDDNWDSRACSATPDQDQEIEQQAARNTARQSR